MNSKQNSKDNNTQVKTHKKTSNKKSSKKQNQRKNLNQRHKSGILTPEQWGQELTSKILATMDKHKEVFFVIRLLEENSPLATKPIVDPDSLQNCDLMDGRDAFLTLAREKHYEFSSLRRAKFSTMALLYELHNSGNGFVYTCNKCKKHVVEVRYHCTECDDFDLCVNCYNQEGHIHKMQRTKLCEFGVLGEDNDSVASMSGSNDMDGTANSDTTSPAEFRRLTIQRCIQSLVHACQCKDANCRSQSCHRMKRVVSHAKSCKKKSAQQLSNQTANCTICKQLIALCCFHAKHCNEQKCPVPYCFNFKNKLQQQKLQQRHEQKQILLRRIASMSSASRSMSSTSSSASNSNSNSQNNNNNSSSIVPSPAGDEYSPSPQSQSPYVNQSYGKGGQAHKSSPPPGL